MSTLIVNAITNDGGTSPSIPGVSEGVIANHLIWQNSAGVVESYNITSVTDLATGRFRINFPDKGTNRYVVLTGLEIDNTERAQTKTCNIDYNTMGSDSFDVVCNFSDANGGSLIDPQRFFIAIVNRVV
jgi:hypothetical protein